MWAASFLLLRTRWTNVPLSNLWPSPTLRLPLSPATIASFMIRRNFFFYKNVSAVCC